ncbi:MAG: anaerobic sulfatase maturase [Desulfobulbus sp.]
MGQHEKDAGIECAEQGLHILAKPIGPLCNLNCEYCFYLEKQVLFGADEHYRMSDEILSTFITQYITTQTTPAVEFVWQGGEPTMLGLEFFKKVVALQQPFVGTKTITNALQTNGTLLDDAWCRFLKRHNFMVGISLDGPREIHNRYRRNRQGKGSFDAVMRGLKLLQKHGVEYNVMVSVARETAFQPLEVYRFFRDAGVEFIQFTPVVERLADQQSAQLGLRLAAPASLDRLEVQTKVTEWSVLPEEYGDFLIAIFEEWVRNDVGSVFVMNFEWAINAWIGNPSPVCVHAKQCGRSLVIEHDGSLYACDHCVYPQYRLGNILADTLPAVVAKSLNTQFGISKETALPRLCRECEVLAACQGGCPNHRFTSTFDDQPGLHYLCPGYKKFFHHIPRYLGIMTQLLENGLPVNLVMDALKGPLAISINP